MGDNITTHESDAFLTAELVKAGQDHVGVSTDRPPLELINPGKHERLLLRLSHHHEV